jgi:hypothetical protein
VLLVDLERERLIDLLARELAAGVPGGKVG